MELENIYREEKTDWKDLKKLARTFVKKDIPLVTDILQKYAISAGDILTGVHCPDCMNIPMIRKAGRWYCKNCSSPSKDAHLQALQDYFLLISSSITNRQFRDFLQLPSISAASKLLIASSLPYSGSTKGRIYLAGDEFLKRN